MGKCTFSAAGTVTISGINHETNSDFCINVIGSNSSFLYLTNCFITANANTAINVDANTFLRMNNCWGAIATTSTSYMTIAGTIELVYCYLNNLIFSTSPIGITSGGSFYAHYSAFFSPITHAGAVMTVDHCNIDLGNNYNLTAFTTSGTLVADIRHNRIETGTASSISVGAGTTGIAANNTVSSSNTNAFTGAGTIYTGGNAFTQSSGNNVTTSNSLVLG